MRTTARVRARLWYSVYSAAALAAATTTVVLIFVGGATWGIVAGLVVLAGGAYGIHHWADTAFDWDEEEK